MNTRSVLLVDDDKNLLASLFDMIKIAAETRPVVVVTASNGSEAYFKAANSKFDLMICDFMMPKTNGVDLVKTIRAQKHHEKIPVIFLTGYPEEVRAKTKGIPSIGIAAKPFDADKFIDIVTKLLGFNASAGKAS
jgi:DNA-binding response OmpR family regulator